MGKTVDRQIQILNILLSRGKDTAANLAHEFEVSLRTIMYDIESLSLTFPITMMKGRGGGIEIDKRFIINNQYFSNEEINYIRKCIEKNMCAADKVMANNIIKKLARTKAD